MSKITPQNIVSKFTRRTQSAIVHHEELLADIHSRKHQATLKTMSAEQFVFNIAVFWELFLNDILVSYLMKSPRQFSKNLENRINKSIKDKFGSMASSMVEFKMPRKLSTRKAALLVDPKNFNISIESAERLIRFANDSLASRHARLFSLDKNDTEFVDFVFAIRNYLAHRSDASRKQLKRSISPLSGVNSNLNDSVSRVGFYLKKDIGGENRSILIGRRMIDIANKFI